VFVIERSVFAGPRGFSSFFPLLLQFFFFFFGISSHLPLNGKEGVREDVWKGAIGTTTCCCLQWKANEGQEAGDDEIQGKGKRRRWWRESGAKKWEVEAEGGAPGDQVTVEAGQGELEEEGRRDGRPPSWR